MCGKGDHHCKRADNERCIHTMTGKNKEVAIKKTKQWGPRLLFLFSVCRAADCWGFLFFLCRRWRGLGSLTLIAGPLSFLSSNRMWNKLCSKLATIKLLNNNRKKKNLYYNKLTLVDSVATWKGHAITTKGVNQPVFFIFISLSQSGCILHRIVFYLGN